MIFLGILLCLVGTVLIVVSNRFPPCIRIIFEMSGILAAVGGGGILAVVDSFTLCPC